MKPRGIFDEFFQEHGCGDGAAVTTAGVHEVGDVGTDQLQILRVYGQAPELFSRTLQGACEMLISVFIVGEDGGVDVAQCHHAGSSEGGGVNKVSAAQRARVMK